MDKEFIKWFENNQESFEVCEYTSIRIANAAWLAAKERYEPKESFIAEALNAKYLKK